MAAIKDAGAWGLGFRVFRVGGVQGLEVFR